jgi:hypothetical protein
VSKFDYSHFLRLKIASGMIEEISIKHNAIGYPNSEASSGIR